MGLRFAIMQRQEYGKGRCLLDLLIKENLFPSLVIEERVALASLSELKKNFFNKIYNNHPDFPNLASMAEMTAEHAIPLCTLSNINNDAQHVLESYQLDLIVLTGVGIIKPYIISIPNYGCINAHPGLLPEIKGSMPVVWSIVNQEQVGCTCHFVDQSVDGGQIISRQVCPVYEKDTLNDVFCRTSALSLKLMINAIKSFTLGDVQKSGQLTDGKEFSWPSDDIISKAELMLRNKSYIHMLSKSDPV